LVQEQLQRQPSRCPFFDFLRDKQAFAVFAISQPKIVWKPQQSWQPQDASSHQPDSTSSGRQGLSRVACVPQPRKLQGAQSVGWADCVALMASRTKDLFLSLWSALMRSAAIAKKSQCLSNRLE
jgi:hypothetical protein